LYLRVSDLGDTPPTIYHIGHISRWAWRLNTDSWWLQVGVFIEHPVENSMASFDSTSAVLDEGMTFVFGSWVCIANVSGGFNSHLANNRKPEASAATQRSNLKFIDNLDEMLLPDLAREIEEQFILDATLTHAAPGLLGSDPTPPEGPRT
jgi:hypothetical protein